MLTVDQLYKYKEMTILSFYYTNMVHHSTCRAHLLHGVAQGGGDAGHEPTIAHPDRSAALLSWCQSRERYATAKPEPQVLWRLLGAASGRVC